MTLDSAGGDAWTFEKQIQGAISGVCKEVVVRTGAASVPAVVTGSRFYAPVPLRQGANELHAECRNDKRIAAQSEAQHWFVQIADEPKAWIRLRATLNSIWADAGRSTPAPGSAAPLTRIEWSQLPGNPAALVEVGAQASLDGALAERIEVRTPEKDGEYYLRLRVTDALGRSDESIAVFRVRGGRALEINLAIEHPRWVDAAVVYGVAPFFFGAAGFDAVRERLDEIAALGATALWISPVTAAAAGDFGYAVTDHFRLRETFGDDASFRRMVERAHALGLKVLIDFVPNHVSTEHRYYRDALRGGKRSAYYAWFDRDEAGEITHYFDWTHLKNLEYDNAEVQNHIIAAFAHWVRDYGVDGFRVDASWAVRERAPEFWPRWRAELKRIDPDLFLLAEASTIDPYYVAHGFDAAYDWTTNLGEWAWREVFDESRVDLGRLRRALTNDGAGFPADALTFRFINNNDTGERFITRHGPALTKLAATLLFTLPGVPLIYNGDEVGAELQPYDEGPPIEWRDAYGLTPHYTRLARLRRERAALQGRQLDVLAMDAAEFVLAYRRPGASAAEDLLVLLNFDTQPRAVRLSDTGARSFVDLLTDSVVETHGREAVLRMGPQQALILRAR